MNIINLNLTPDNVMLDNEGNVKLFGYGLGRLTDYGKLVSFPIGSPRYTAPDVLRRGMLKGAALDLDLEAANPGELPMSIPEECEPPDSPQADVWSLGMILARRLLGVHQFWPQARLGQILRKIVSLGECETGASVLEKLAREHGCLDRLQGLDPVVLELVHTCLAPRSGDRPTPEQLIYSDPLIQLSSALANFSIPAFPVMEMRSRSLKARPVTPKGKQPLDLLTVREIYYLWQLAGGDVMAELRKHGLMITTPPVISTPSLVTGEGQVKIISRRKCVINFLKHNSSPWL